MVRPLSVQEITSVAQDFDFHVNQPLQQWFRAGKLLLTEAAICEQDGNLQMTYLYLYRHAELVMSKLPQHPEYQDPKYKDDLAQARRALRRNLLKLEQLKPRISQEHQRYVHAMGRRSAERQRVEGEGENQSRHQHTRSEDGMFANHEQALNASEHSELAVDLAHRELKRRDLSRQTTRQAGISPSTVANRRRGIIAGPSGPGKMIDDKRDGPGVDDGVREVGRRLHPGDGQSRPDGAAPSRNPASKPYNYPSVPTKEEIIDWRNTPALQRKPIPSARDAPPALPAKHSISTVAPPIPPKPQLARTSSPQAASPPSSPPTAHPRPMSKYTFKPNAFTESGKPLRTVLLPPDLRTTFLNIAHPNTLRNLETCAILCGTLISNALFINHLIIPDQNSSSDTCDTTEEGDNALFDYCDGADLLVCGWIHTHPSQTCFLSSRDLHTSSGYQIMLPEAIAIVCAPRHNPDWGIFRLTDPPGLKAVLNCRQQGLFHPHSESNLYTDALRPGHVIEGPGLKFEVVDLRKS